MRLSLACWFLGCVLLTLGCGSSSDKKVIDPNEIPPDLQAVLDQQERAREAREAGENQ
jgi:hypothetical protein